MDDTKHELVNDFRKVPDPYENFTTPEMYGDLQCSVCHGRGRLDAPTPEGYRGPPSLIMCKCVLRKEIIKNTNRIMYDLIHARKVIRSPLLGRIHDDLRISADVEWFRANMRYVALRQNPNWDCRIVTDAELVTAWLATAAAKGMEIFDADVRNEVEKRSLRYMTLADISGSATLLIVKLGVKSAPNKEAPNVLLEALRTRMHEGLPTWLWEQPEAPLAQGHRCWSEEVDYELSGWDTINGRDGDLDAMSKALPPTPRVSIKVAPPPKRISEDVSIGEVVIEEIPRTRPSIETHKESAQYDSGDALKRMLAGMGDDTDTPYKKKRKGFR